MPNDPDMGDIPKKVLLWQKSPLLKPFGFCFPNVLDYGSQLINNYLYLRPGTDHGQIGWQNKLYSDSNLQKYSVVVRNLKNYCDSLHIKLLVAYTPGTGETYYPEYYSKDGYYARLDKLFGDAGIETLDLRPVVDDTLKGKNLRKYWANPGNGHPGEALHTIYANEVYNYIVKTDWLEPLK